MENKNGEDGKRSSERIHPDPPSVTSSSASNEPNLDLVLAMSLQELEEQDLTDDDEPQTDEDLDDDDDDDDDEEEEEFDYEEYSTSQEVNTELEFLEEEGDDTEMEEDEIDPDEMSYEELIELGETIGSAELRGLSQDKISLCLCPINYPKVDLRTGTDQCVVCQTEYEEGEQLVALSCKHVYHAECIAQWLQVKKTCPICTTEISPPKTIDDDRCC